MIRVKFSGVLIGERKNIDWSSEDASLVDFINLLHEKIPDHVHKIIDDNNNIRSFINIYINGEPITSYSNINFRAKDEILVIGSVAGG